MATPWVRKGFDGTLVVLFFKTMQEASGGPVRDKGFVEFIDVMFVACR